MVGVLDAVVEWSEDEKLRAIIAIGECGYEFDLSSDDLNALDVEIYHFDSLEELAMEFVEDGILGDIPEALERYIDYAPLARELAVNYTEAEIAGHRHIYRAA